MPDSTAKTNAETRIESSLRAALADLRLGDFQSRWDTAKRLSSFEEAAIAPLIALQDELTSDEEDWELMWFIARILGTIDHPDAIAALVNLIYATQNEEVAGMAATGLASLGKAAIAPLQTLLAAESTYRLGIQALAQIRHPDVVPPLLEAAHHASPRLRLAAIEALSDFQHPQIFGVLVNALQDPVAAIRQAAVTILGLQAELDNRQDLTEKLVPLLWDFNLEVCRQAAIALGRLETEVATAKLSQVLQSPHTPLVLQIEAVRALAWVGSLGALSCLQAFLQLQAEAVNPAVPACHEIIIVLGRVEPVEAERATNLLLHLLQSHHPIAEAIPGRQAIALSLGQLGQPQALDALIQLLADESASVRFHAIAALKQFDKNLEQKQEPLAALQYLQALAAQETLTPQLQQGVAIALQEWGT